jgi:Na+/phosphate symporter
MTSSTPLPAGPSRLLRFSKLGFWLLVCLFLFILGLEHIKLGAKPLVGWFKPSGAASLSGALGTGWILACVVLSGSPIAALALGLLESGELEPLETFAMITGSRLGASFVVLLVGFIYDLRARRHGGGVYVGALALITTATVYLPAFGIGYVVLKGGWLDGVRFGLATELQSVLKPMTSPFLALSGQIFPPWGQSLLGIGLIVSAFKLFDGFLPAIDPTGGKLGQMATTIYRPWMTFLFGMLVTSITLSVSVSLTILVPLTARGVVRRENMIPYIMGANITTFVDTLFASLLLQNQNGFTIVLCEMLAVTAVSLPIVFLTYRPFERLVDSLARSVTQSHLRLALFVFVLFLIPLFLIWMQ